MRRLLISAIITTASILLESDYWRPFLAIAAAVIGLIEIQALLDRRRICRMREIDIDRGVTNTSAVDQEIA